VRVRLRNVPPVKFTDGERFAALDAGGTTLALVVGTEDITGGTPAISVRVVDLLAAIQRLVAGGAAVVSPAAEGPHEVRTVLRDPAGQLVVVYAKR
jgi:predicted enzyme related to lactoylglutathione lyase